MTNIPPNSHIPPATPTLDHAPAPTRWRLAWPFLFWALPLAAITALLSILSAGAGHGNYLLMRLLCPLAALGVRFGWFPRPGDMWRFLLILALQWPVYCILVSLLYHTRWRHLIWLALFLLHALLVTAAFALWTH